MQIDKKNIVVMGLGYIGLPTASMLATKGHHVLGVDVNKKTIDTINSGRIHIVEPDLDILVKSAVNSGNLRAGSVPEKADVFILAVPTPFIEEEGRDEKVPDLTCVDSAIRAIAPVIASGNLIILESTSPVGTTERIMEILHEVRPQLFSSGAKIYVAHCPERVLPGHILRELVDNDRIIGGIDRASAEMAAALYRSFCSGSIFLTDSRTAEMTKLVENSFRDVNIAFANELSIICDRLGINVWEMIDLANKHPRVNVLKPGPGVGGHCIAVDPWFIVATAPQEARLIRTARNVNDSKPHWVLEKVRAKAQRFRDPVIGCLGLTFKANIDDLRESPALDIVRELVRADVGRIMVCEPNAGEDFKEFSLSSLPEILEVADIILLLVDHKEFVDVDKEFIKEKIVIDTRGIWR